MKLNLHGLEATFLCEDANDAIVEVEIADEVRVLVIGSGTKRSAMQEASEV